MDISRYVSLGNRNSGHAFSEVGFILQVLVQPVMSGVG